MAVGGTTDWTLLLIGCCDKEAGLPWAWMGLLIGWCKKGGGTKRGSGSKVGGASFWGAWLQIEGSC